MGIMPSSWGLQRRTTSGLQRRGRQPNGNSHATSHGCANGCASCDEEVPLFDSSPVTATTTTKLTATTSPPHCKMHLVASAMTIIDAQLKKKKAVYQWLRVHRRRLLVVVFLLFLTGVLFRKQLLQLRYDLYGEHYIVGLLAGSIVQDRGLKWVYHQTLKKQEQELREMGVYLPRAATKGSAGNLLNIRTQAALRELLIRREERGRILFSLERSAMENVCRHSGGLMDCKIPKVIFIPSMLSWIPRPGTLPGFARLLFDEAEMRDLVNDVMPSLAPIFDSLGVHERVYLWSLCAVYHFGGVFLGTFDRIQSQVALKDDLLLVPVYNFILNGTASRGPIGIAAFQNSSRTSSDADQGLGIYMVAATHRHAHLLCLLRDLESRVNDSISSLSIPKLLYHSSYDPQTSGWNGFRTSMIHGCDTVRLQNVPSTGPGTLQALQDVDSESRPDFFVLQRETTIMQSEPMQNVAVTITSQAALSPGTTTKVSIRSQLQGNGAEPSWFCTQCLRLPSYGTMRDCKSLCPTQYTSLICSGPDIPEKFDVPIEVLVKQTKSSSSSRPHSIPKIIHQTWFEQLDIDHYPDLSRLQNSWKQSGWEYRFYTDETARSYIVENFPSRFVDAFDALIPGAYRADLFRYLVLMKEGGVYADMDVLLETTLDTFVTPTLSFFAARDCVAEFAGQPFCLWNGLIGAAPGHPFIIRAVERLVNHVSNRADAYDMERDLCRQNSTNRSGVVPDTANMGNDQFEIWKVRLETLLLLSGPCALGAAVNDVLGRPSLQALELGWISLEALDYGTPPGQHDLYDYGDALILTLDKFDFGAFRFSDSERNLIVASTQLEGLEKKPRVVRHATEGVLQRQRDAQAAFKPNTHYSETQKGVIVWGHKGVYRDNLVSPERLVFRIHYAR